MSFPKRWKATIEVGENWVSTITGYKYGESLSHLLSSTCIYLKANKPLYFTNGGDQIAGIYRYFYFEKTKTPVEFLKPENRNLEEGWWYDRQDLITGNPLYTQRQYDPERLENFEAAVEHFLKCAIIPEKGPDYQSIALVEKNLQLPLLEKILREDNDHPVNDLIQRGWHIIALEYNGEASITGDLINRKAVFVMGHPEVRAALFTLNSPYYRRILDQLSKKTRRE